MTVKPPLWVHRNGAQLSPVARAPATAVAAGLMAWISTIVVPSGGEKTVAAPSAAHRTRTVRPLTVAHPIDALPSAASRSAALGTPTESIGLGEPFTHFAATSVS